jgi:hypothetical protein
MFNDAAGRRGGRRVVFWAEMRISEGAGVAGERCWGGGRGRMSAVEEVLK